MAANQVDFKILPSDQFSVYSPATRSDKVITYFTLLSKLRGDILSVGQEDDPNNIVSAFYSSVGGTQTLHLVKADGSEVTASVPEPTVGTVTSVDLTASTGISVSGGPITTSGSITVTNTAPDQVVVLTGAGTTSISGTYPSFTITSNDQFVGTVTSVGLTMPAAFSVANSPVTASGTLAVTAAGLSSQYIRGDGQLANFPTPGGGGSSVNYYLNGSVSQGTFGGDTYYELSKVPIAGAGTNFTRAHGLGDGYIASFITDANDPDQINIPGGNWNLEFYFNSSSSGGSPAFYGELYKVSISNVFTLIASGSVNPESITGGTTVDQYYTSIAVPQTALLSTDRLAIRVYVIVSGKDITLHTENSNFCEVITTFSTGLNSLNGLSDQVQYFAVGTSGTDFAISSSLDTHTFNLPTASATNRGALSSADWTTFNGKASDAFKTIAVTGQSDIVADSATDTLNIVAGSGVTLTTNDTTDTLTISATGSGGTVTSVDLTAGTGISVSGGPITGSGSITVNNTAPDQTVVLTASTGITTSGTYPNFTIANSAPDQTVVLTGGTGITTSGTYPSFTVTNSAPDQTVVLTAGTGITTSGTYPSFTVTNSAPDQTVALTAGTGISISGTYPSFTITNTSAGGGTITGSGTTNYVPKWTSASAIGDSAIYDNAGNVGIGTTSPAYKFHVQGSNLMATFRNSDTAANQYTQLEFVAGSRYAYIWLGNQNTTSWAGDGGLNIYTETGNMDFWTAATQKMRLTTSGNLGIGTTSPTAPLDTNGVRIGRNFSIADRATVRLDANGDAPADVLFGRTVAANESGWNGVYWSISSRNSGAGAAEGNKFTIWRGSAHTAPYNSENQFITITPDLNVGIGETSPSQKLHVSGNIRVTGAYYDSSNGAGTSGQILSSTGTGTSWIAAPSGGGITGSGTTNYVSKFTSGTAIGNSQIFDDGTSVGIGTTAPNAKLDVSGGITLRNTRVSTNQKYPVGHYSFGETVFEIDPTWAQSQLQDFFGSTGVTWINDSTAPGGYAIQIDGEVNVGGVYNSGFLYIPVDSSQDDWFYMECWIRNDAGSSIQHYMGGIDFNESFSSLGGNPGSFTYNVMMNYNPGTSWTKVYGYWNGFGNSAGGAGTGNTNNWESGTKYFTPQALFNYGLSSGIRRSYISGWKCVRVRATGNRYYSDNVLVSGNVGIGTTGPSYKLEVNGLAAASRYILNSVPTSGFEGSLTAIAGDSTYNILAGPANGPTIRARWSGGTVNRYLEFGQTDNAGSYSANIRIAEGNVGINNTSPSYRLDVSGTAYVSDDLLVGATNATSWHRISIATGGFIAQSGGRGIGAYVDATAAEFFAYNYNTPAYIPLLISSSTLNIANNAGSSIIYHNGTNVGIGTTAPGYKLDVSGTIRATGDVIAYSDARVKENVETIDGALDKVMKMRGVSYNKIGEQEKKVGVIAQEILEVLPEVVSQDDTGTYSVAYGNISAVLIEAIKELTNTVKEQQLQIDELKSKLK